MGFRPLLWASLNSCCGCITMRVQNFQDVVIRMRAISNQLVGDVVLREVELYGSNIRILASNYNTKCLIDFMNCHVIRIEGFEAEKGTLRNIFHSLELSAVLDVMRGMMPEGSAAAEEDMSTFTKVNSTNLLQHNAMYSERRWQTSFNARASASMGGSSGSPAVSQVSWISGVFTTGLTTGSGSIVVMIHWLEHAIGNKSRQPYQHVGASHPPTF